MQTVTALRGSESVTTTAPELRIASERPAHAVLEIVESIARDLDSYDLDGIDGEFLWRWCRRQVMPLVNEMQAIEKSGSVRYLDGVEANQLGFIQSAPGVEHRAPNSSNWSPFADESSWLEYARYSSLRSAAEAIVPEPVLWRLLKGKPVTLRPPEISLNLRAFSDGTEAWFVLVLVHSSNWVGEDLEGAIETAIRTFSLQRENLEDGWIHRTQGEFLIIEDRKLLRDLLGRATKPSRLPCIGVLVPLPLCSPGGIGREYDAVVRNQYRWHLKLPGATASRQLKEVALRTWGVGLLLRLDQRFGPAMRRVCESGRICEVSQARFGVDRKRLIERVPEAREYLMQRQ
jgi:hypothetical protein